MIGVAENDLRTHRVRIARGATTFTLACVPTGMYWGVSMTPWLVVNRSSSRLTVRAIFKELEHGMRNPHLLLVRINCIS